MSDEPPRGHRPFAQGAKRRTGRGPDRAPARRCTNRAAGHERVDALAARVRWLDRHRRMLALAAAAIVAPLLIVELAELLGAEWPQMHATLLSLMLGVIVWWIVEVGLAYVTAVWETEHSRLVRDRGLPRAILWRWRR